MEYCDEKDLINKSSNKESFIVFSSTKWCPNCRLVDALIAGENIDTSNMIKIDPEQTGTAMMLGVESVPSFSKYVDGELYKVYEGVLGGDEIKELVESVTVKSEKEGDNSNESNQ